MCLIAISYWQLEKTPVTIPTHILLGLIIGKVTGDYTAGILSSTLIDLDHFQSYYKHGLLSKPKELWSRLTDQSDPYGDQRGVLHSIYVFIVASIVLAALFPEVGPILVIGWFGHLCLDALDNSDYWPFYPNKKINLRGPVKYNTWQELLFFILLVVVYLLV